jgi:GNAT superfamily N-acetyltransferase
MIPESQQISAIQSYLRENARRQYESFLLPPFTLFFHPMDAFTNFNYAIPDFSAGGDLNSVLHRLKGEFHKRKRVPRFEFLEAFAPDLPAALKAAGFAEAERQWGMTCTPETIQPTAAISGLSITALHPESPAADIRDFIFTQRQGFSPGYPEMPGEAEIRQARLDFLVGGWQAFIGRIGDEPAAAGSTGRIIDGVTEAAGIATRPIFRRRGIASYLTWHITHQAFEHGARIAYLTAADAAAGRMYERTGYQPFTIMLTYTSD